MIEVYKQKENLSKAATKERQNKNKTILSVAENAAFVKEGRSI